MSEYVKWGKGLRLSGHALNPDKSGCNCGARPEGWDKSIPVRDWHREHKVNVVQWEDREEKQ